MSAGFNYNKKMQHSCGVSYSIAVSFKDYFCKPMPFTLNIILYKFNVSRVYVHTISQYHSEYINSGTISHIIIFVMKQITLQLFGLNVGLHRIVHLIYILFLSSNFICFIPVFINNA